jgi:hypothetical protein
MTAFYTVQPITDYTIFTTPDRDRVLSPWDASWSRTLKDLQRELEHLEGHDVILELDILPGKIRRDGLPMADAKVRHVGVRLSFDSKHGAMSYTADRYRDGWQTNVRAIALTLDRLRAVDRYGATKGEQYAGFAALPAGTGGIALGGMTKTEAESVLTKIVGAFDRSEGRERFRRARAMSHPDRNDGDQSLWDQVEQAGRVLGLTS